MLGALFAVAIGAMVISVVLVFLAPVIKNEKINKFLTSLSVILMISEMFWVMGGIIPVYILTNMFEGIEGILYIIVVCIVVYFVISVYNKIRNLIIFKKNDIKDIYIRNVEVEYSPAVLSYLMNQNIENKKDLSATLLNLCSKNILKIEKNEDKTIRIIDLKNKEKIEELSEDEKYAYNMFIKGVTTSKINTWRKKVEEEYKKYSFSKESKQPFSFYMLCLYGGIILLPLIIFLLFGDWEHGAKLMEMLPQLMVIVFFGAWESGILYGIRLTISEAFKTNTPKEFRDKYSEKGAKEYMKWKKFEKFIEDYTLVEEKEHASIVLLGKYLSYSIALGINTKCDAEIYNKIQKEYDFEIDLLDNIDKKG